jgi:hypothetical protein
MSLIATATYLSTPSLVSLALTFLLRTVGPLTVVRYLNFAVGDGIGPRKPCDAEPAIGLELVALPYEHAQDAAPTARRNAADIFSKSFDALSLARAQGDFNTEEVKKEDPTDHESCADSDDSPDLYLRYGAVSDMIGQAATIWLARWGVDMLVYEAQAASRVPKSAPISPTTPSRPSTAPSPSTSLPAHRLSASMSWFSSSTPLQFVPSVIPVVWRRGGLGAAWIRAVVSSDTLFVKGERQRYEFAKAVVDLRRSEGIDEEEEKEFSAMFAEGIYYPNMVRDCSQSESGRLIHIADRRGSCVDIARDLSDDETPLRSPLYRPSCALEPFSPATQYLPLQVIPAILASSKHYRTRS